MGLRQAHQSQLCEALRSSATRCQTCSEASRNPRFWARVPCVAPTGSGQDQAGRTARFFHLLPSSVPELLAIGTCSKFRPGNRLGRLLSFMANLFGKRPSYFSRPLTLAEVHHTPAEVWAVILSEGLPWEEDKDAVVAQDFAMEGHRRYSFIFVVPRQHISLPTLSAQWKEQLIRALRQHGRFDRPPI